MQRGHTFSWVLTQHHKQNPQKLFHNVLALYCHVCLAGRDQLIWTVKCQILDEDQCCFHDQEDP